MNVQKVMINRVLKQYSIFFAGVAAAMIGQHACENAIINDIKTEVMTKYPDKYNQIDKNAKNLPLMSRKIYWNKALINLDNSARIAGEAKKAYIEGGNNVRNKTVTVKK